MISGSGAWRALTIRVKKAKNVSIALPQNGVSTSALATHLLLSAAITHTSHGSRESSF